MYYSRFNHIVSLESLPGQSVLNNLYSGNAIFLDSNIARQLDNADDRAALLTQRPDIASMLQDRAFVFNTRAEEDQRIRSRFEMESTVLLGANKLRQYVILLSYGCNFKCSYCFQGNGRKDTAPISASRLDLVLAAIDQMESNAKDLFLEQENRFNPSTKPPLVNIIGGEPLQLSKQHLDSFHKIAAFCCSRKLIYSITSNGYHLKEFVPEILKHKYRPGDVQITLDGIGPDHDRRRPHRKHGGSFHKIIEGIETAAKAKIHTSLRINLDHSNIDTISQICDFIKEKGWYQHPSIFPYLAPVTDHSGNLGAYNGICDETDILSGALSAAEKDEAVIDIFSFKNFRGFNFVKTCVMEDDTPAPTFWRCEALLGQTVFDPQGKVYACFESAGQKGASIGRYDPTFELYPDRINNWAVRQAMTNPTCSECKYVFICAGGCPWNAIKLGTPSCTSIGKQIDLGWNYFTKLAQASSPAPK